MKFKDFIAKNGKIVAIIFTIIFGFVLLVTSIVMLSQYRSEIAERSSAKAQYLTLQVRNIVEDEISSNVAKTMSVANALSEKTSQSEIYSYISSLSQKSDYSNVFRVRYFKGDNLYESNNDECTETNDTAIAYKVQNPNKAGYAGAFNTSLNDGTDAVMTVLAYYAPVKDSSIIDGIVLYYTRNIINDFFRSVQISELAEDSALCISNGKIVAGGNTFSGNDIFYSIRELVGDKAPIDEITNYLEEGIDGSVYVSIKNEDYVISIGANKDKLDDLSIIELYNVNTLYASSFDFVHSIISIIILFAVITLCVIIFLIIRDAQMRVKLFKMETNHDNLNCLNRYGFEKEATKLILRNPTANFAVVVLNLRHYKYLLEQFGESEVNSLKRYLNMAFRKLMKEEEIYGYASEGDFLMFIHERDHQEIMERLKIVSFLAKQYKGAGKFDIAFKYGIYEVNMYENLEVSKMIDFAYESINTAGHENIQDANSQFSFYNEDLRKIRLINEDMELRMEGALENNEFQVFYQPKFNLNKNVQDGAEALVRWYDKSTGVYNPPALFMQLFESNGFIVKLDKYVYTKVCEYINYSVVNGLPIYPISVNISRITAVQPDFIDFYTRIKRKYNVSDGQIMVEFTESFAYENYQILEDIVDKLHKNGFKCSIDDFGCGYSSYRILKSLPMDEIKLDKFFLEKSKDEKRDSFIFESIIELAKNLGMKVTQEGIETKEELEKLRAFGCDVIQGYYYSRPIPLTDYIEFVNHSKDHKI